MAEATEVRRGKRKFCDHCRELVSIATYYRHREAFFDPVKQQWRRSKVRRTCSSSSESESETTRCDIEHDTCVSEAVEG